MISNKTVRRLSLPLLSSYSSSSLLGATPLSSCSSRREREREREREWRETTP
jgi:hypothetical protein